MQNQKRKLVEIMTSVISGTVIEGGKVFISVEDSRSILKLTRGSYKSKEDYDNMLEQCKLLLETFAESILFSNDKVPTQIYEIANKYRKD